MSDIAVVVPVLNRPHRAAPFMESFLAASNHRPVSVFAVVGENQPADMGAWLDAHANVMVAPFLTFAEKVNYAYRMTVAPWLFLTGDDVAFHGGWADELLRVAGVTGAKVIGSNDLTNPRTAEGTHSPHMLISRRYIAEQGASWDGPGVVCHEGYRHMFVDDEIVTVAKQRGVFALAKDAIVEHLHPVSGKSEVDATYRLGWSFADLDKSRFAERMREFAL